MVNKEYNAYATEIMSLSINWYPSEIEIVFNAQYAFYSNRLHKLGVEPVLATRESIHCANYSTCVILFFVRVYADKIFQEKLPWNSR